MDFDTPIDRTASASFKWDVYDPGVLPLWVADMDFASPPPVVAALEARARHGVFGYALVPDSMFEALERAPAEALRRGGSSGTGSCGCRASCPA